MVNLLLKNTSYLTLSRILNKVLSLLLVIAISGKLGVEGLGIYGFIFAFVNFIFLFVNMGDPVIIRELAANKNKTGEYLWNAFYLRISLVIFAYLALTIITRFYPITNDVKQLVYICGLVFMVEYLSSFPHIAFASHQKFKFSAVRIVIRDSITVGLGLLFLLYGKGLLWVLYAFLIGRFIEAIYTFNALFKYFWEFKIYRLNFFLWRRWLKQSFYFLLQFGFVRSSFNLSVLIISFFMGAYYVGIYHAATRIVDGIYAVYRGFLTAVYPYYSSFTMNDELKKKYSACRNYSLIFAILIFLILILSSKFIINIIYGTKFSESIIVLNILSIGLVFSILGKNALTFLNAIKKEKINSYFLVVIFFLNISLSILLIKPYGVTGVAISGVICSFFYFLILSLYIKKINTKNSFP